MSYSAIMLDNQNSGTRTFLRARAKARTEKLWSWLHRRSARLLCFRDVEDHLLGEGQHRVNFAEIPVQAIVGSIERCTDYSRSFLPLKDNDQARWTRVEQAYLQSKPLPPIQVRQVGSSYFVIDGHHRVSVARQMGLSHLEAQVHRVENQMGVDSSKRRCQTEDLCSSPTL
jgi:hypothetical protein